MIATAGAGHRWRGGDDRGSVAIEFAFAFPIAVTVLLGVIEMALVVFTMILMEAGVREASRYGITGRTDSGLTREQSILHIIDTTTVGLLDMSKAHVETRVYPDFGSVGTGEAFVDANGNGVYDAGETFTDGNGNGTWDSDVGTAGLGTAGQVVLYRLSYDWTYLTPLASFIGGSDTLTLTASVAVRNEPQ